MSHSDFDNQRYPTVEETVANNASVLYKRKKFFLKDLRNLASTLGYVLIGLLYLRDLSMLFFVARTMLHHYLSDPFPPPPHIFGLDTPQQAEARAYGKMVFILFFNVLAFLYHCFAVASGRQMAGDGLLHGGLTVQFIGELPPATKWENLALDVLILCLQVFYHLITCGVDDLEVLQAKPVQEDGTGCVSLEVVSNGYNGNVTLLQIDILSHMKKTLLVRTETLRISMNRNSLRVLDTEPQVSGLLFSRSMTERMV